MTNIRRGKVKEMLRMRRNHVSILNIAKAMRLGNDTVTDVLKEQMSEAEWDSICSGVKSRAAADSHVGKVKKQPQVDRVDVMQQTFAMGLI